MAHTSIFRGARISIKNDRIDFLERREKALDDNLTMRLFLIAEELKTVNKALETVVAAQELFYDTFMANTLKGRWRRFVAWLGKK